MVLALVSLSTDNGTGSVKLAGNTVTLLSKCSGWSPSVYCVQHSRSVSTASFPLDQASDSTSIRGTFQCLRKSVTALLFLWGAVADGLNSIHTSPPHPRKSNKKKKLSSQPKWLMGSTIFSFQTTKPAQSVEYYISLNSLLQIPIGYRVGSTLAAHSFTITVLSPAQTQNLFPPLL